MKFVTSDHHFFHKRISKYCNRQFKSVDEMNHIMILNWCRLVSPGDIVYHLGDFAMVGPSQWEKIKSILNKLNGIHYLILGNHDECKPAKYVNVGFTRVHTSIRLQITEEWILELHHDPSTYTITSNLHEKDSIIFLHGHILHLLNHSYV